MIKSSCIHLKDVNKGKSEALSAFACAYRNAVAFYVKYYFSLNFKCLKDHQNPTALKQWTFYPYSVEPKSILSGRALKCAKNQAMGLIKAQTKQQNKRVYMLQKLLAEGKQQKEVKHLLAAINRTRITKPQVPKNLPMELNSIILSCSKSSTKNFDIAFDFSSLFCKEYKKQLGFNKFTILAKKHRHFNALASRGEMMPSFLVSSTKINVRFDIPKAPRITQGEVLGVDQGAKTCISCSSANGTHFVSAKCAHGWDLDSIMQKLSRKTKGSAAFKKAQEHRKNYIHWTINQLDLSQAKELRLEKLFDMRRGHSTSRYLSHFAFPLIQTKLQDKCEQMGVLFVLQESPYMSQRCSSCGFVHKNNRIGKTFKCKICGFTADADLNASRNHLVTLPSLDRFLVLNYNKQGFLWNPGFDGPYSAIK